MIAQVFKRLTFEERVKLTEFVIEADSFAQLELWSRHHDHMRWEEISSGFVETVGKLGRRPVAISVSWALLNGHPVMFWYGCSEVVDHKQIRKWFKKNCSPTYENGRRPARADAMNFSHVFGVVGRPEAA